MTQRIRSLKRQLNEVEEEASRKEVQYRHTQRELAEERENTSRLERQLLEQHLQNKYVKDSYSILCHLCRRLIYVSFYLYSTGIKEHN